jgi:hypothetical protein
MTNRETLVTVTAFIAAIFGFVTLIARLGSSIARSLLVKLYDLFFPHKNQAR